MQERQKERKRRKEIGNKGGGRKKKINLTLLPLLEDNCVCEFHLLIINPTPIPNEASFLVWVLALILQVQRICLIFLLPGNPQTASHSSL